jgi:hypothetical protein
MSHTGQPLILVLVPGTERQSRTARLPRGTDTRYGSGKRVKAFPEKKEREEVL